MKDPHPRSYLLLTCVASFYTYAPAIMNYLVLSDPHLIHTMPFVLNTIFVLVLVSPTHLSRFSVISAAKPLILSCFSRSLSAILCVYTVSYSLINVLELSALPNYPLRETTMIFSENVGAYICIYTHTL